MIEVTPENVSGAENQMVMQAAQDYGDYYRHARAMQLLLWGFIKEATPRTVSYNLFLGEVRKVSVLTLLAIVRLHASQSQVNLRMLLESMVLSAYALEHDDITEYYEVGSDGAALVKEQASDKAYKWLEKNYQEESKFIKMMKNNINSLWSHSNVLHGSLNTKVVKPGSFVQTFFDNKDIYHINGFLWNYGNIHWMYLRLVEKINESKKELILIEDFRKRMITLGQENENQKRQLMSSERYKKHRPQS
ncbi:hypothetical protein EPO05_05210 [Patescibacteria group bacterium]|nr:MAG: hypothetical protein EPO05_05210 [Patescibacteria group bacterium]